MGSSLILVGQGYGMVPNPLEQETCPCKT